MERSFPEQGYWKQLFTDYGRTNAYLKGFDLSQENWNTLVRELTRKGKTRNLRFKSTQ